MYASFEFDEVPKQRRVSSGNHGKKNGVEKRCKPDITAAMLRIGIGRPKSYLPESRVEHRATSFMATPKTASFLRETFPPIFNFLHNFHNQYILLATHLPQLEKPQSSWGFY